MYVCSRLFPQSSQYIALFTIYNLSKTDTGPMLQYQRLQLAQDSNWLEKLNLRN